jgi:hypothetical protein
VHAKARMAIERAQMRVCVLAIHSTAHDKECTCVGVRLSVRLMQCSPSTQQLTIESVRVLVYACACMSVHASQCSPLQSSEYSSSSSWTPPSSSSLGGHAAQASSGTVLALSRLPEPPSTLSWASSHSPSLYISILEFQCYRQRGHTVAQCMRVIRLWRSRTQWIEVKGSLLDSR